MIITLSLNPSVDTYYQISNFKIGNVNRPTSIVKSAGGKGNNVARVLSALGNQKSLIATGYIGGLNGNIIHADMNKNKIETSYRKTPNETRNCIIVDDGHKQTNINETYNIDNTSEQTFTWTDKLIDMFDKNHIAGETDYLILAGSLPNDYPVDTYSKILININQLRPNIKLIVDSSGEPFKLSINSGVPLEFIKPNLDELNELLNIQIHNEDDITDQLMRQSMPNVANLIVSNGHKKAYARFGDTIYQITPPEINAVNATGSGDASLAGALYGLCNNLNNLDNLDTIRYSMSCGADNALHVQSGMIDINSVKKLCTQVNYKQLN
ncbi:1-phosphofructokinase family hexose kinase [Dellaglioa sp. L3N]